MHAAAAQARAAAAAAAVIGQITAQGYPVEGQPSDVTVTVRHAASAAAAAEEEPVTAAQRGAAVAPLSTDVVSKAAEAGRLQVELEQQLTQVTITLA